MQNIKNIVVSLLIIIGLFIVGFFVGKSYSVKHTEPKIEYIKGETIRDSIPYPVPVEVVKPIDTASVIRQCVKDGIYTDLFPEKITPGDTAYIPVKEDTTAILKDWGTMRRYSETLFDNDTLGRFVLNAGVQYNRLSSYSYDFEPVYRETTVIQEKVPLFSPFLGAGLGSNYSFLLQGGVFIKGHYGVSVFLTNDFKDQRSYVGGMFLYRF